MFTTKEDFDSAYRMAAERNGHPSTRQGVYLNYHRHVMYPMSERRAKVLVDRLGIQPGETVLVVGCGFGWTVEAMNDYCVAIGTETSPYILENMHVSEEVDIAAAIRNVGLDPYEGEGAALKAELLGDGIRTRAVILNEDSLTEQSRNSVEASVGEIDYVITEDVLPGFSDQDAVTFAGSLALYQAPVYHIITPLLVKAEQDPVFNWKTINQWKELVGESQYIMPVGELQVY